MACVTRHYYHLYDLAPVKRNGTVHNKCYRLRENDVPLCGWHNNSLCNRFELLNTEHCAVAAKDIFSWGSKHNLGAHLQKDRH